MVPHDIYVEDESSPALSIKEIYKEFRYSEFYDNLNKAEQRSNNEKSFKESIRTHFVLKKHYKAGHEYVEGVRLGKDSLISFKKSSADSDDDNDLLDLA